MKAIKFSEKLNEAVRERMKEAIAMSATLGKECGFSFCDNTPSPIICNAPHYVSFPSCAQGRLKGAFHVHLKADGMSGMDIVSAVATNADVDCLGYKDGEVKCYDIKRMKASAEELSNRIKEEYKSVVKGEKVSIEEAVRQLAPLASEASARLKPIPF